MEKRDNSLETETISFTEKFLKTIKEKEIYVVSHFDTDGITSATIIIQTLKNLDMKFTLKIIKSLEKEFILNLPQDKIILFLDLASGSLKHLNETKLKDIFIIDHHEITQEIPENITILNSELHENEKISSSGLTYLVSKQINPQNKEFAKLAILGMIGDQLGKNIERINHNILKDGEIKTKRGLLIYPSTRPLNRTLEYSSDPYIPGVTGNTKGVLELMREVGLINKQFKCKSLIELDEKEMKKLVTAIMLRNPKTKNKSIIGDIFLIKLFNKLEDAREISAMINACSRLGRSDIAIQLCLEIAKSKKQAESIYVKYKQHIVSGLKFVSENNHQKGKKFIIINAKEQIKETIIGTIASILSKSLVYEPGTIITTMAYYENKIKISARNTGDTGRNVRELLETVINNIGGEVGGHKQAAGAMIYQEKEQEFINLLKKNLEVEVVKV